ncbi:baseplate J/gp47 family protein [Accumulibacter sp.]|uniref:baseplate J/gp47 family protein n=1 Tax=Accumulibacter sp. TaxID=2053492 RepID=UPI0025FCBD32|nr:baseplate J/gp47 family protein [Accumulibacter sp.]MCM8595125.1 baseplate J/gp47 family protein [Accumulibacter sp.]MCM8625511.1 baseplate J/gp47 family protein [Accumulibacter sp.]MDS4049271.1 baseplate J/gp47 family protein [Accumulibacter sp.]
MSFLTPDYPAIRDAILRDIANQLPSAAIGVDSDYALRASAHASAVEGLYQHQQWIVRQILPDTADTDFLERHASLRGLSRKAATAASGTITFSGVAGSAVPIGTEAKTAGLVAYVTTAADVIGGGGTVTVAAQAEQTGTAGNQTAATALTLTSAPPGVLSSASIATMSGGTDLETDAELLARLLFVLRNPPCGGAAHDYYTWAMACDGVTAAYVYPNRRGLGTTDVVIMTSGGIPGAGLIATVQAAIDLVRPVQADFLVLAPTAVPVAVAASLTLAAGAVTATVRASIDAALTAYFASLSPGDTAYLSRIRAIVSDTSGVVDFTMTAPTGNTAALVDSTHTQLATLGTTTWS